MNRDPEMERLMEVKVTIPMYGRSDQVTKLLATMKRELELKFGTKVRIEHLNPDPEVDPDQLEFDL